MAANTDLSGNDGKIHFRGHIGELDALRAVGSLIVLTAHLCPKVLSPFLYSLGECGWIAMDSFFVLSGFLITGILVDTRERPDYFRNYFVRRSLRVFPLYYLVLLGLVAIIHLSWGGSGGEVQRLHEWGSPGWFFFYLGNFRTAYMNRLPSVIGFDPLWSLQIEEQFYLLFPLAVLWLRRDHLVKLLWTLVFLSPVFRILFYLHDPGNPFLQFVLLPCHMEGLALGALIAIRIRSGPWKIHRPTLVVVTSILLLTVCISSIWATPTMEDWSASSVFNRLPGYSISSWGCAGLILLLILYRDSVYTRWSKFRPLQYIGTISYGLYLLHTPAWRVLRFAGRFGLHMRATGWPHFIAAIALSIVLASLSWFLLEKPILKLKDRLAPRPDRTPNSGASNPGASNSGAERLEATPVPSQ